MALTDESSEAVLGWQQDFIDGEVLPAISALSEDTNRTVAEGFVVTHNHYVHIDRVFGACDDGSIFVAVADTSVIPVQSKLGRHIRGVEKEGWPRPINEFESLRRALGFVNEDDGDVRDELVPAIRHTIDVEQGLVTDRVNISVARRLRLVGEAHSYRHEPVRSFAEAMLDRFGANDPDRDRGHATMGTLTKLALDHVNTTAREITRNSVYPRLRTYRGTCAITSPFYRSSDYQNSALFTELQMGNKEGVVNIMGMHPKSIQKLLATIEVLGTADDSEVDDAQIERLLEFWDRPPKGHQIGALRYLSPELAAELPYLRTDREVGLEEFRAGILDDLETKLDASAG